MFSNACSVVCIAVKDARTVLLVHSLFNLCALCGMSYYRKRGCASKQEGVCFLVAAMLQIEWRPPERRGHCFPQSYAAHGEAPSMLGRTRPTAPGRCWEAGENGEGGREKVSSRSTGQAQVKL